MIENFLKLYNEELHDMRVQGEIFADNYPKIAGRLRLGKNSIEDPLVGRLMESFAFMTARMRHKMDAGLDNVADNIINLLYPHYLLPVPCCSTLQFSPKEQLDKPLIIPAKTVIESKIEDTESCCFTTCYPVKLWPVHLSDATYQRKMTVKPKKYIGREIKSVLELKLNANNPDISLAELGIDSLRFFIKSEKQSANSIYELLMWHTKEIIIKCRSTGKTISVPVSAICSVGFSDKDGLLPYPPHSFIGYRLLSEFFSFAEKFLYFDLNELDKYIPANETEVELYFYFGELDAALETIINGDTFALGCVPVVNIFEQVGEPITVDQTQSAYHVIADAHRPKENIEVYMLQSLDVSTSQQDDEIICQPYFGKKFIDKGQNKYLYWHTFKKAGWELGDNYLSGYESFVSFSNIGYFQGLSDNIIVTPKLLCTNRELPTQLLFGNKANLYFKDTSYELVNSISFITPVTSPVYRNKNKISKNDLVSHLFLSQICFTNSSDTLGSLQDALLLYNSDDDLMVTGLVAAETKMITERHPESLRQGFCKGIELTLTIDEKNFHENNAYLFGCVLHEFLTLSCSVNSFIKLIMKSKQRGEIYRWKPKLGIKPNL